MGGGGTSDGLKSAQHRDASHAKVTSQISVGSMPRAGLTSGSERGGGTNISLPPTLKRGGHMYAPLAPPPGSYASDCSCLGLQAPTASKPAYRSTDIYI